LYAESVLCSCVIFNTELDYFLADFKLLPPGAKTLYQRRRHLLQMHTTNYMPFIREKAAY